MIQTIAFFRVYRGHVVIEGFTMRLAQKINGKLCHAINSELKVLPGLTR